MRKNKISAMFLILVLAIAGIGVSYAGFTDVITVFGSVNTATVDLVVEDYSGTDVWKVWMDEGLPPAPYDNEVFIYRGFFAGRPTKAEVLTATGADNAELVASAWSSDGTDSDVLMTFDNLFPCIDFTADVMIHYKGSIPAHVTVTDLVWDASLFDFSPYATFKAFSYTKVEGAWVKGDLVTFPLQMHYCEYIGIEVTIHIPQNNEMQGLSGAFSFNINAIQWNDECDQTTPDKTGLVFLPPVVDPSPIFSKFNHPYGKYYFKSTISGIGPEGSPDETDPDNSYNVWDGEWPSFCVDSYGYIANGGTYRVKMYSTYDPLCPKPDADWPKVNWLINNMDDYPTANWKDFQEAIWFFVDGGAEPTTTLGKQIRTDMLAHGDFVPQAGQLIAVVLWPVNADGSVAMYDATHEVQKTFIIIDP